MTALPTHLPRCRFVHRRLAALGARSTEISGGPVALSYGVFEESAATAPLQLNVPPLHRGVGCV